jgi:hypothetical protein
LQLVYERFGLIFGCFFSDIAVQCLYALWDFGNVEEGPIVEAELVASGLVLCKGFESYYWETVGKLHI